MSTSSIKVLRNNMPLANASVSLEYTGLMQSGFTKKVYTDSNGIAIVSHSSTGNATVYINGSNVGTMQTPGSASFTV